MTAPATITSSLTGKLDYQQMVKCGRKLKANSGNLPVVRVAILGDNSAQQLVNVLKASLLGQQFYPEIYEAGIDSLATEILDDRSGLHAFRPDYVWLNLSSQGYRERFYAAGAEVKETLPANYADEISALVGVLAEKGHQVIINLLAPPQERFFGNYSAQTFHSLHASIAEVNRRFVQKCRATPQCLLNDLGYVAASVGLQNWYDERLWSHAKYLCAPRCFPLITESVAAIIRTTRGRLIKCVVLDLDNTLWGGVVGDSGIEGIEVGGIGVGESFERFQRYLKQLKERGLILAVCSKNDPEVAVQPFRNHSGMVLREDDIAVFVANWNAKSANIEHIIKVLNIGADSVMFVDDSPFERNEVRQALPAVVVPEMPEDAADFPAVLEAGGFFEAVNFSAADRNRTQMYQEEARRTTLQIRAKNIDDYLASLEMKIACRPFDSQQLPRIAQLLQRSNQFNLRTQRFSEGRCREFMERADQYPCFYITLKDNVGDYGLVSVVCAQVAENRLVILEYVMSCRVLNRGVEQFVITFLVDYCKKHGLSRIRGEYIASAKNKMVGKFYEQFGFRCCGGSEAQTVWELLTADYVAPKCFIKPHQD